MTHRRALLLAILLVALALRLAGLTELPPGLTHDEANHGRDAIGILDGIHRFYFPLNYGSEPLYNYVVAGAMAALGETLFALRLVNVLAGVAAIAVTALWARRRLDRATALLAAALMAVSFWPLATSRQALRAGLLPLLVATAVLFFWRILDAARSPSPGRLSRTALWPVVAFGLAVTLSLHDYLAARVVWLVFPLFLVYLLLVARGQARRAWPPTLAGLILAGLLVVPMFAYLSNHPEAETRLEMLDGPLQELRTGNFGPTLGRSAAALAALVWPGRGDDFLAYNIPGRPVLEPLSALFFVLGTAVCLARRRRPTYVFLLLWLGVGILPSLITGPAANTTRNLGALPALYLITAVGAVAAGRWLATRRPATRPFLPPLAALFVLIVALVDGRAYFQTWGQSPNVRAAYQHTLAEMLIFAGQSAAVTAAPPVLSTVYPGAAHDPSIALVLAPAVADAGRWVDGRHALVFPEGEATTLLAPASAPPHPAFAQWSRPLAERALRPDDLDPVYRLYDLAPGAWPSAAQAIFGDAVALLDSRWLSDPVVPGATAELLTVWRVENPANAGPVVPPAFTTDAVFFTHLLDASGAILAQRDALDAPSWAWRAGDIIVQVHPLVIPPAASPGAYTAVVGVYDRLSGARLPVRDAAGEPAGDVAPVAPLQVAAP